MIPVAGALLLLAFAFWISPDAQIPASSNPSETAGVSSEGGRSPADSPEAEVRPGPAPIRAGVGSTQLVVEVRAIEGPVAGATVRWAPAEAEVQTDRQGVAVFELSTPGRGRLVVEAAGFDLETRQLELEAGTERRVRVWLRSLVELRGFVGLPSGQPASKAEVRNGEETTQTDAAGRFTLRAQLGDILTVDEARGRASVRITERLWAARFAVLRLSPPPEAPGTGRIGGLVVDEADGAPVPEVVIQLRAGHGAPFSTVTDPSGRFGLQVPTDVRFELHGRSPDGRAVSKDGVAAGQLDLTLLLTSARGTLEGLVVDAEGRPTPAFVLRYARAGGSPAERSVFDEDGSFEISNLQGGRYRVEAVAAAGAAARARDVEVPEVGRAFVELRLAPPGTITGRVVDAEGQPLADPVVRLESRAGLGAAPMTRGDGQGRFTLGPVAPGRRSLSAWVQGYRKKIVSGLDVASGETLGPIEIALRPSESGGPDLELVGIGAALQPNGDVLVVQQVIQGGGAAEAGLAPGARITAIDGTAVAELGFDGAIQAIRGREGTTVQLTLESEGGSQLLTLSRRRIAT